MSGFTPRALVFLAVVSVGEAFDKDVLGSEDVCSGTPGAACALNELQSRAEEKQATTDTSAHDIADDCPIVSRPQDKFPPTMVVGTKDNIGYGKGHEGLDLDGVWWLRWPLKPHGFGFFKLINWMQTMWYNWMRFELLLSWAGTSATSDGFPSLFPMPIAQKHQWAYGNNYGGSIWQSGQAQSVPINWTFVNNSFAYENSQGYIFIKESADVWLRPTNMPTNPPPYGTGPTHVTWTYKMTRIVDGNGKKTKYWDDWKKEGYDYRIWNVGQDNAYDLCLRKEAAWRALWFQFLPLSTICNQAKNACKDEK